MPAGRQPSGAVSPAHPLRSAQCLLPRVQGLGAVILCILSVFLVAHSRGAGSVPVTLSWSEERSLSLLFSGESFKSL